MRRLTPRWSRRTRSRVGLRIVYAGVFSLLDLGRVGPHVRPLVSEQQAMVFSVSVAFVVFGGLAKAWTRNVLNVVVTSAAMFLLGMIALAWAMYLADQGDPDLAWRYIVPAGPEYLGALVSAGAAALGWDVVRRFSRRQHAAT